MTHSDFDASYDELDPINVAETFIESAGWDFERMRDDQIALAVEGQWRTYSLTLAWSNYDETLRLVCTFEIEPPEDTLPTLYEGINLVNDQCWVGAFTYWEAQQLMVFRYGLVLSGVQVPTPSQIDTMINTAVASAERFYPAFELMIWSGKTPQEALGVAITKAYGHA